MTSRTRSAPPARRGERGFTLAETAIALLIMMIASVGIVSLFTYAIQYNAGAKDRELAMAVAQKRMEWLRGIPFDVTTRAKSYATGGLGKTAGGVTETVFVPHEVPVKVTLLVVRVLFLAWILKT